jgi:hypothetical protein
MPYHEATQAAVAEIATRCAPSIKVIMGLRLWSALRDREDIASFARTKHLSDGGVAYEHYGAAWTRTNVPAGEAPMIMIAMNRGTAHVTSTMHHEIWHAVEWNLAAVDRNAVHVQSHRGVQLPGTYLDSCVERRARMYQHWAAAYAEGWRPPMVMGIPMNHVDRVFLHVYSGALARRMASGRRPLPHAIPGVAPCRRVLSEIGWQGLMAVGLSAFLLLRH